MEILEKHNRSSEKIEKRPHYNFEEIERLKIPIENLVSQLKEAIDTGEYDTLISDDVGGRNPTRVLERIIHTRIRSLNPNLTPEEDRESLKTFFIAAGTYTDNELEILDFFKKIKPGVKRRALLITEYIFSGRSIERIVTKLKNSGIPFDIASVASSEVKGEYGALNGKSFISSLFKKFPGHKLFIGREGTKTPEIYGRYDLAGVKKASGLDAVDRAHPILYKTGESAVVLEKTMEDVNTLANEVLKRVWGK